MLVGTWGGLGHHYRLALCFISDVLRAALRVLTAQGGCRDGLRELFYGVYQRDSDKCLDALETMGVLVGGDRTSIKRTAEFFLKSFDDRLAEQRKEREEAPETQGSFKPKRSKEDSKAKRKEVRRCHSVSLHLPQHAGGAL